MLDVLLDRNDRHLTFSDTGLVNGTSYSYRVRATDAAANLSAYSIRRAPRRLIRRLQRRRALTATAVTGTQINLSWTASTGNVGVTNYLVERCQGGGYCFGQFGTASTTTFNDTTVSPSTSYSYRVPRRVQRQI